VKVNSLLQPSGSRIVLVYPEYNTSEVFSSAYLPVGLGYLARSLELSSVDYEILDLNIDSTAQLEALISRNHPEYLGISMMSYKCSKTYELLRTIKSSFPWLKILVGGPHVTTNLERVLQDCEAIDICVAGEGEQAVVEIVTGKPWNDVKGAIYRKDGLIEINEGREFIKEMDDIPFPTYSGFKLEKYGRTMQLSSSRGCPNRCIFCGAPKILGKKWRRRSAPKMIEELIYWHKRGYKEFAFNDSNFAVNKKRVEELCDGIMRCNLNVSLSVEGLRADGVDAELLRRMHLAGFNAITFGVESGSNEVLKNLKKGETIEQIESAIKASIDLGFSIGLFFLVGSPGEGLNDLESSLQFACKYDVASVNFFNLVPIPGTEYYEWALSHNYIDPYGGRYPDENFGFSSAACFGTDTLSVTELNKWLKRVRQIERQIMRKRVLEKHLNRLIPRKISLQPIMKNNYLRPIVFCAASNMLLRGLVMAYRMVHAPRSVLHKGRDCILHKSN
jgi:anaerobic magnesium-protoporphyrin IX monomethyl ester cyclase